MNVLFRLFLTFNATSLIIVVYLAKEQFVLGDIVSCFDIIPDFISYLIYILIPICLTYVSLTFSNFLDDDSIHSDKTPVIKEVEQANNAFLPSYLGYFFVALSVPYFETLFFVFIILFVFTFLSQTLYFNPLYLIFGYHFYYVTTNTSVKVFIISKRILKDPKNLSFQRLKRINNFTFIDREV
ncbi:hypothetical protein [Psychrobacillus sp. OK032]|uniref:hypothetical protein n=1 Tax=Psychrobacillus sp. OK032 TaxID=1884358 RepID=UPI0008C72D8B|nr:hypothetical protein [Psychrobacillus sp. OK032]SES46066.1 hypothetical protein SAMN05518872_1236 [Psychrobacillus sp. OK032]